MPRPLPETSGNIGNFMSKPARGWLHPDQLISKKGVTYAVRVRLTLYNLVICSLLFPPNIATLHFDVVHVIQINGCNKLSG